MKKRIAILGSTGSIGKSTLDVIRKDKKNFDVVFLSANNNYKKLISQAKEFKVKNVFIKNRKYFSVVKKSLKNTNTTIGFVRFNDFGEIEYIFVNPLFRRRNFALKLLKLVRDKTGKNIVFQNPLSPLGKKLLASIKKIK